MELRQLNYFVHLAEKLNFSEAAKSLFVTQSTLSQQIKQLEQELDAVLLDRNSHGVSLTEAGAELLPYAKLTLRQARECTDRMADLKALACGTLNIGVTHSFSPILNETLTDFMKEHPKVKLNLFYSTTSELLEMLRQRQVDFALTFRPSRPAPDIESHILFQTYLAAIVAPSHPLASKNSVSLPELSRHELALPSVTLQARSSLSQLSGANEFPLKVRVEANEVNLLLKLVKSGKLATVLAEATVLGEPDVKAVRIEASGNEMTGCIHLLRNAYHKESMRAFLKMLSSSVAVRARAEAWI